MKLGISSASFFPNFKTEETFDLMRSLGVDVAEVFLTTFSEFEHDFAVLLKERKGLIDINSVHAYGTAFEPMLYNAAERTRGDSERMMQKVLNAAKVLGAKSYTFHGQSRLKKTYKYDLAKIGKRTEELCGIAKSYGVEIAFENVHWALFNEPDVFIELKNQSPSLKCCLDVKQAKQSGYSYKEYIEVMADRLVTVHITDYDDNGNTTLPYKGICDFEDLFIRLKDAGYNGAVLLEVYGKDYSSYIELLPIINRLKETMDKVGVLEN